MPGCGAACSSPTVQRAASSAFTYLRSPHQAQRGTDIPLSSTSHQSRITSHVFYVLYNQHFRDPPTSVHGSVDILEGESMPQAIEIIGKAEEEGLANLGRQASPRGARGELALDHRKDGFHLGALPVRFFRNGAVHLIANG